jgi:hypothetical protein
MIMEEKTVVKDGVHFTEDMKMLVKLQEYEESAYTIPEGVTGIGDEAFRWCDDLEVITLSGSVANIGRGAFSAKELRAIAVAEGNSVYAARDGVLFSKDMKTLVCYPPAKEGSAYAIPDSVTNIEDNVFFKCQSLTEITVPAGVTEIDDAFRGAGELQAIAVAEGSAAYATRDGVLFTKDMKTLMCYPPAKDDSAYEIPEGVTGVREGATGVLPLLRLNIPLEDIRDEGVFYECENLTSLTVPRSMTKIGEGAFHGCEYLTEVTISVGVTSIGKGAFAGCENMVNLTIPPGVTDIGEKAFSGCRDLTAVAIPAGVTSIGKGMFEDCSSLASLTIPPSVTGIGDYAFSGCRNLPQITIPAGVKTIGEGAFERCGKLTGLIIPDSVTAIGKSAFNAERLRSITVTEGNAAYASRDGVLFTKDMKTLVCYPQAKAGAAYEIPADVTSIEDEAFEGCDDDLTIRAGAGSYAAEYARKHEIRFEPV